MIMIMIIIIIIVIAIRDGMYLIGITCGLSAPYVAGQIDYMLNLNNEVKHKNEFGAAVMGFNPVELARNQPIEKFNNEKPFRDVARQLLEVSLYDSNFSVLNPIIGPEPVSGSSRMKGGSATAVLLDVLCIRAIGLVTGLLPSHHPLYTTSQRSIFDLLMMYNDTHNRTYNSMISTLNTTMNDASESLKKDNGQG